MKAIARRIRRLETTACPHSGKQSGRIAMVLYERRRRRAEAEGKPFTDAPPDLTTVGPRLSIAETLRRRRSLRYEARVAESNRLAEEQKQ